MDYNYGNEDYNNTTNRMPQNTDKNSNGLAIASLVLGIVSIVTCCVGGFMFGSLGIILALLSKGKEQKYDTKAKVGIVTSITGMVLGIVIIILLIIDVAVFSGSNGFDNIMQYYEQQLEHPESNDFQTYFNSPDTL